MTRKRFGIYAWGVLAYTLVVILWGAYVRATGSGAGCGAHWPLCNGVVLPRAERLETLIEFTHRLSSGLLGILTLVLPVWAWRIFPTGHPARRGALYATFFVITEGLIGAGLVLLELVADNDSAVRAVAIAGHLVNTLLLLASLVLTISWANGKRPLSWRGQGTAGWLLGVGFAGLILLSASGAVTALGDTLFPAESLASGLAAELSPTAHFLIRLRLWHPALAIMLGLYLISAATTIAQLRPSPTIIHLSRSLKWLFLLQLGAGGLNVLLLVPVWMQLVHLLLADIVWILFVFLAVEIMGQPQAAISRQPAVLTGD